jgi:hypothetical protein
MKLPRIAESLLRSRCEVPIFLGFVVWLFSGVWHDRVRKSAGQLGSVQKDTYSKRRDLIRNSASLWGKIHNPVFCTSCIVFLLCGQRMVRTSLMIKREGVRNLRRVRGDFLPVAVVAEVNAGPIRGQWQQYSRPSATESLLDRDSSTKGPIVLGSSALAVLSMSSPARPGRESEIAVGVSVVFLDGIFVPAGPLGEPKTLSPDESPPGLNTMRGRAL